MSPGDYQKLPGGFRGFIRGYSLWAGPDHLLFVDSTRFSETYKRFYFQDIQAIIIRKTPRFAVPYYWILCAIAAAIAMSLGLAQRRFGFLWPPAALAIAAIGIYLYVAAMFQSCTCHLITRVNKTEMPSLFRLGSARRFMALLSPRLSAAQGELPADWVERSAMLGELSTSADRNPDDPADLLPPSRFSWITVVVFVLILIDAGFTWLQLRTGDASSYSTLNIVNMLALGVFGTFAIVRLSRQKGVRPLRILVLGGLFVVAGVNYGALTLQSIDQQIYHQTFKTMLQYPGMLALSIVEIVADFAVAIPGLFLTFRQTQNPQPRSFSLYGERTPNP